MKKFNLLILILFIFVWFNSNAQDYHVRVAFIGNSITEGAGLSDAKNQSYPAVTGRLLKEIYGDTCIVNNYGVSGRTLLKKGDFPIWKEPKFTEMWKFAPDIVFILMGTNDSKPYNWDDYGDEFYEDYMSLIDSMKVRNPRAKFIISFPPPAYQVVFDIRNPIILNEIIPLIDSLRNVTGFPLVDFYNPLVDSVSLFPDFIHPGVAGSELMAKMVFDKFVETDIVHQIETGYTFVTNVKSDKKVIQPGGEVTISWTSINADSVLVNGVKCDVNGSLKIYPNETSKYAVYAYGQKSIDSMIHTQTVYIPELEKIAITPKTKTMDQYDSLQITLKFYDQENQPISTEGMKVEWKVKEGGGLFADQKNESATFIATVAGKTIVSASVGEITSEARITVNEKVGVDSDHLNSKVNVFPNPVIDKLNFEFYSDSKENIVARIVDLKGSECMKQNFQANGNMNNKFEININTLTPGIYLLEIAGSEKLYSGRIVKE